MTFDLAGSIEVLANTPAALEHLFDGLSNQWVMNNEGVGTWSPSDVVRHLILAEKFNWMPRLHIILSDPDTTFPVFNRTPASEGDTPTPISGLLREFRDLRTKNLELLKSLCLTEKDLDRVGRHPEFGQITLRQLLSTWTVHDLAHFSQITRTMAKQYKAEVGPWVAYLRILNS